jgi:hypothetical protein
MAEHIRTADIAGMNDDLAALQCLDSLGPDQSMRVGYEAYHLGHGALQAY